MKIGIGIAFFILTLIFANMALENNKLAREITMREFNVKPLIENEHGQKINELPLGNTSNGTVEAKEEKWKTFEEDFNRQWKNF